MMMYYQHPATTNTTSYIKYQRTMGLPTFQKQAIPIFFNIHYSHLFFSSRISLFLAWSSAIIGPPPIPPPCVTTITYKAFILQTVKMLTRFQSCCFCSSQILMYHKFNSNLFYLLNYLCDIRLHETSTGFYKCCNFFHLCLFSVFLEIYWLAAF
jgi:hypothetical protein